jgi:hypothetical protein
MPRVSPVTFLFLFSGRQEDQEPNDRFLYRSFYIFPRHHRRGTKEECLFNKEHFRPYVPVISPQLTLLLSMTVRRD